MRPLLALLLAVACGLPGLRVEGKTLKFEEHDLELTTPDDWLPSPPGAGVVAVYHNQIAQKIGGDTSIGSKAVTLMVATFPKEVAIDPLAFVERQREAMQQKGAIVAGTGERTMGPLLFYLTKLSDGDLDRPVSYLCTAFGNDRAVTLVLSSRVADPSIDPQFDAILRSVHFISPYRPITQLTLSVRLKGFAHRHPVAVSILGLTGIAALVVLGIMVKQAGAGGRTRRSSRRKS